MVLGTGVLDKVLSTGVLGTGYRGTGYRVLDTGVLSIALRYWVQGTV